MKLTKTTGVVAVAIVALCAADAAAQAPTLSVSANGPTVTINWTALPGATGYNLVVSGALTADINLPPSLTNIVVNAPAGTYNLQVRGTAGSQAGPFSNVATVTVASTPQGGACLPLTAPTIGSSVSGSVVTINWGAVPGAAGYRLQVGTAPGATQFTQDFGPGQLSFTSALPVTGTFYARVIAGNACGVTLSSAPDHSFTVGATTPGPSPGPTPGNLPRTPDPPAGQILPRPNYGQETVIQLAAQFNFDLQNSCAARGGNHVFMYRVANALRQRDSRWGMNQKRGNQGLSEDIITYNPTALPDAQAQQIYMWDIMGNHCPISGGVTWNWTAVDQGTWAAGQARTPGCANAWCALWYIPQEYFRLGFQ